MATENIDSTASSSANSSSLCVVGFVYFETYVPALEKQPQSGTEVFVPEITLSLGAAFTPAAVAQAMGCSTVLCYPQGDGLADSAAQTCLEAHALSCAPWRSRANPAISVVFSSPDDRAFISAADFDCIRECPSLPPSTWIHVVGLREAFALERQLSEAQSRGARVSVSASWAPAELDSLLNRTAIKWDLLILNRMEAERVAQSAENVLSELATDSTDVIVTLGKNGAVAMIGGSRYQIAAQPTQVIDPSGAGDAFCAGYLAGTIQGKSPKESLELGIRAASLIIQSSGSLCYNFALIEKLKELG